MDNFDNPLISCGAGVCSLIAGWETPQHKRSTELDRLVEPQADRAEIARTGSPELTAPMYGVAGREALQEIAGKVSHALACLTDRLR